MYRGGYRGHGHPHGRPPGHAYGHYKPVIGPRMLHPRTDTDIPEVTGTEPGPWEFHAWTRAVRVYWPLCAAAACAT